MSSFLRRIQRQAAPSRCIHPVIVGGKKTGEMYANPPREKFYQGRGSNLGVCNPKATDLVARLKREAKRAAKRSK